MIAAAFALATVTSAYGLGTAVEPGAICQDYSCTYRCQQHGVERCRTHVLGYQESTESWRCGYRETTNQPGTDGHEAMCECRCHESFSCTLTHHGSQHHFCEANRSVQLKKLQFVLSIRSTAARARALLTTSLGFFASFIEQVIVETLSHDAHAHARVSYLVFF